MMFNRNRLAIAVMAATSAMVNAEQLPAAQPTMMQQVTVTATRTEKVVKDVAGSVTVIDEEQLESNLVRDIKDMVRYEPGVVVRNDGRTGNKGFNIRGIDENRIKIMIDGVDQAKSFQPGGNYLRSERNFIDIEAIKAVEIVKGPASSLYGSDAIGGLVAFQTKDPADYLKKEGDDSYASVKGSYASANKGLTETLSLANRSGDLETLLVYTRSDYEETKTHSGEDIDGKGRGKADPLDAGLNNLLIKALYQLNGGHRLGLTGEYHDKKTETVLKSIKPGTAQEQVLGDDKNKRSRIGFSHEWDAGHQAFDRMSWQLDWQDTRTDMETRMPAYTSMGMPFANRLQDYHYKEQSYQLNAQFDKSLEASSGSHHLIYGFSAIRKDVINKSVSNNLDTGTSTRTDYIPEVKASGYGLFVQDDVALSDNLAVIAGARYDRFDYDPETTAGFATPSKGLDKGKATAKLGVVYKLHPDASLFARFSQGFKMPDVNDLYHTVSNHGYTFLANPDLKPEESNSFELGIRGHHRYGEYELAGFFNRYKNFIERVTLVPYAPPPNASSAVYQMQNAEKAEIWGYELNTRLWLDEAIGAPQGTTLKAALAYAEGENTEKDTPLNSISPLKVVFGLAYDAPSDVWGGELNWTLVAAKEEKDIARGLDGEKYYEAPGYGVVDLTAYYKPASQLTLSAGLFNLTDKQYWIWDDVREVAQTGRSATPRSGLDRYAQPGRNFSISAKYVF
ncbi:TonB-dependent hemoglobin/transferrin/lactoferrin family receptor [Endozoicomonas lisbonensis]|uniref:Hemoglobin/transferrin/lactoferrin receptor protein n=1 Tax=Endozoicomonas lisbonensis TaxID=3120522 RepID=A0ABV2SGN5_9GAMM